MRTTTMCGTVAAAALGGAALIGWAGDGPKQSGPGFAYDRGVLTYYVVSDFGRSLAWYTDVLGLEVHMKVDEMGWAELTTAVPNALLAISKEEKVDAAGGGTFVLSVKDLDAARKVLEGRGVRFEGPTTVLEGMVKLATFFDPDGNQLMFSQSLAPAGAPPPTGR